MSMRVHALADLNAAVPADFVAALAGIFEHSPWVAEQVLPLRPLLLQPQE